MNHPVPLPRRLLAKFTGTALLITVVVGSGIAAQQLSPNDVGLQLLENSTATVFGLAVLILLFGPVSGAHFNPVVSAADWLLGRRAGTGISVSHVASYTVAQITGGVVGAVLGNIMFDRRVFEIATKEHVRHRCAHPCATVLPWPGWSPACTSRRWPTSSATPRSRSLATSTATQATTPHGLPSTAWSISSAFWTSEPTLLSTPRGGMKKTGPDFSETASHLRVFWSG